MTNYDVIEKLYMENLERDIITELAKARNIGYEEAMKLYYDSRISKLIEDGKNDVQYLDYKNLVEYIN